MSKLNGKIAVITGGARGLGAVTARLFAHEGAKVVIADVLEEGQALADDIGTDRAFFVRHDVTKEEDWRNLDQFVQDRFGQTDVLVNNAGVVCYGLIVDQDYSEFERAIRINLCGTFLGIKVLSPSMCRSGGGSIINVSSAVGLLANNGLGAYAATKWAVRGLSKTAALELSPHGVRVNSVHPGPINTAMGNPTGQSENDVNKMHNNLPARRIGRPEEVAMVLLFLASDDASFVTGAEYAVDGGMSAGSYLSYLPGAPIPAS